MLLREHFFSNAWLTEGRHMKRACKIFTLKVMIKMRVPYDTFENN
jgi:hypothetical protein